MRTTAAACESGEHEHIPVEPPFPQVNSSDIAGLEQDAFPDGGINLAGSHMLALAAVMKACRAASDERQVTVLTVAAAPKERCVESSRSAALSGLGSVWSWLS